MHLFANFFFQNCFCGLGVKVFFSILYPKNCQVSICFAKKPCQIKSFSLITKKFVSNILRAGHTHSKNLNALQLKKNLFVPFQVSFFHFIKSLQKRFSPTTKKILHHQPKGKPHTQCYNFYERCNYNT